MSPPEILWAQRSSSDDPSRNIIYLWVVPNQFSLGFGAPGREFLAVLCASPINARFLVFPHKSTINVPDLQPSYTLTFPSPSSLSFKGSCGSQAVDSKSFEIDSLQLFGEVDTEADRKEKLTGKSLQIVLTKKDLKEEYWPRFVVIPNVPSCIFPIWISAIYTNQRLTTHPNSSG